MGGFLPTAAMSILQLGAQSAQMRQQVAQRNQQAELARASQEAQAQAQIAQIRQSTEANVRQRQDTLRRALATQRARFGAQGIGTSGSAAAVLGGMAAEAERGGQDADDLARLRIHQIQDQTAWQNRKNLLDASQFANRSAFNLIQQGLRRVPLLDI